MADKKTLEKENTEMKTSIKEQGNALDASNEMLKSARKKIEQLEKSLADSEKDITRLENKAKAKNKEKFCLLSINSLSGETDVKMSEMFSTRDARLLSMVIMKAVKRQVWLNPDNHLKKKKKK